MFPFLDFEPFILTINSKSDLGHGTNLLPLWSLPHPGLFRLYLRLVMPIHRPSAITVIASPRLSDSTGYGPALRNATTPHFLPLPADICLYPTDCTLHNPNCLECPKRLPYSCSRAG